MNTVRAIDIRLLGKQRTGDEAVFFHLTKELLSMDQDHQYLLLTDERDPQKIAVLQGRLCCVGKQNVRFVSLYGRNRFLWNVFTLPWFLYTKHVDTFHTQYILPLWVPKRTKVLLHIHDVSFRAFPRLIGWSDRLFLRLLIPRSLRRANMILVPSQFTREEVVREYGVASDTIVVIPNALDESFLSPKQLECDVVRAKYGLPARFILYVGTLQPRKNIPLLIRAFARLQKRIPDMYLVLVGNKRAHHVDPDIDRALCESEVSDRVFFPGYVSAPELPTLYSCATVFAFPSLYEGFGIPLLEAMSQGVPVAASDTLALREVAQDAVSYFDPTSVAQCEEILYTLCTDDNRRQSGISLGKSRISFFSWRKSATLLSRVYAKLEEL